MVVPLSYGAGLAELFGDRGWGRIDVLRHINLPCLLPVGTTIAFREPDDEERIPTAKIESIWYDEPSDEITLDCKPIKWALPATAAEMIAELEYLAVAGWAPMEEGGIEYFRGLMTNGAAS